MPSYLINVQSTYKVNADSEDEAFENFMEFGPNEGYLIDQDVMMVGEVDA